jgi:dATP pyrophosphohydrolase
VSELRPNAVGVVVLRGDGESARMLVIRRGRGVFAGAWTIVMGVVEPGERATETARREVLEETGLAVTTLYTAGVLDAFYDPVKDRIVNVPFFVARVEDGEVCIDEAHDEHRWVTLDDAAPLLTFSAQRRLLDEVRAAFLQGEPEGWRRVG